MKKRRRSCHCAGVHVSRSDKQPCRAKGILSRNGKKWCRKCYEREFRYIDARFTPKRRGLLP